MVGVLSFLPSIFLLFIGSKIEHKLEVLNFWAPKIFRQFSRSIPPNRLFSLCFEGHTKLFAPPLHAEDPTEDIRTEKFEFVLLSCLILQKVKKTRRLVARINQGIQKAQEKKDSVVYNVDKGTPTQVILQQGTLTLAQNVPTTSYM